MVTTRTNIINNFVYKKTLFQRKHADQWFDGYSHFTSPGRFTKPSEMFFNIGVLKTLSL